MDAKTTSWVSYITLIGWIVAYCAGDKEGAKFHLNQSLIIHIILLCLPVALFILAFIPFLGALLLLCSYVVYIFLFVVWIIGLVYAINQEEKEIPLIGKIKILK